MWLLHICIYVTTISKKEAINLKENKEVGGMWEGLKGEKGRRK